MFKNKIRFKNYYTLANDFFLLYKFIFLYLERVILPYMNSGV